MNDLQSGAVLFLALAILLVFVTLSGEEPRRPA